MKAKPYASPKAFQIGLDARLKNSTTPGRNIERLRQLLIFERFLARIAVEFADAIVLKGGFVLELRLARPRMTKDVP